MTEDLLAELVVVCTERIERDGPAALDEVCREHPEHALALREALQPLLQCGIVGQTSRAHERPERIGEYEIVRELGRGGMGVVYEAMQSSLERPIALKVLAESLVADDVSVERFRREGATAALLQHRGIAQVYAVGHAEGHHFLAMELIVGAPLDRVIGVLRDRPVGSLNQSSLRLAAAEICGVIAEATVPPRSPRPEGHVHAVMEIGEQIAAALTAAHEGAVIHRDVKPSNVMLRADGSVVLTDFGLARRRDDPSLTRAGTFAGTPFFTSPEQAAGGSEVDHRTDLFSLGVLLYELLTLQLPFSGGSSAEVLRAIQHKEPVDPRRWNRGIPIDVVAILQRLLEKEPDRRYPTAASLAADLRALLESRPVAARPITWPGRVRRWARRQPLQATFAVVLAVGIPLVTVLATYAWQTQSTLAAARQQQQLATAQESILAGYIALGEGRPAEAVELLRDALTILPDDVEAWAGLTQASLRPDRQDAATLLAEIERRTELLAGSRSLQRCRAQLLERSGRNAEARAELERLGEPAEPVESFWVGMQLISEVAKNDKPEDARTAYAHLLDAVVESPVARPAFLYWLAVAAGELGDETGARRAARALQRNWPDSGFAWSGVGLALNRIDPEAAIAAYRRALALMPHRLAVRNNLANALRNAGRRAESTVELRELVRLDPNYATAQYNLGRNLFYDASLEEALPHLQRAVELSPTDLRSQHYYSWCLLRLDRATDALAAARAATDALPDQALLWRDLARAQLAVTDMSAAQKAAERAVELAPTDPANHSLLAELAVARGDVDGARTSLERVVELSSNARGKQRAREDLARFLIRDEDGSPGPDPVRGLAMAQALVAETGRQDPWLLHLLAKAYHQNGDLAACLRELDAVLLMLPDPTRPDEQQLRQAAAQSRVTVRQELAAGDAGK